MGNPSLTEKSIIGYEVVPAIAHDPAKCPGTKRIQTVALMDSDAPNFAAIQQDRENLGPEHLYPNYLLKVMKRVF